MQRGGKSPFLPGSDAPLVVQLPRQGLFMETDPCQRGHIELDACQAESAMADGGDSIIAVTFCPILVAYYVTRGSENIEGTGK